MTILKTLIDRTDFELARPLWNQGLAYAVFEPFFAYMLINLTQHKELVWYQTFITHSADAAKMSLQTGEFMQELDLYWRKTHLDLKEQLIAHTNADDGVLATALPLAVHTAWQYIANLASQQEQSVQEFAESQLPQTLQSLPSWLENVLDEGALAQLSVERLMLESLQVEALTGQKQDLTDHQTIVQNHPSTLANHSDDGLYNDESDVANENDDDEEQAQTRSILPIVLGVLLLALAGAGAWYVWQGKQTQSKAEEIAPAPLVAQSRPPATLSLSTGGQGELYACHARLGNKAQSDELLQVLTTSFGNTSCVMDISEQVSQTMAGLDKLTNALALLKTAPYATLELSGNQVLINSPNPADISRLVEGVGALMVGLSVMPMPALNPNESINQSLTQAAAALSKLPDGANPHELAQALNLQKIDTQTGAIPQINKAVLALSAGKIATSPQTRLIIVVHSDDTGDRAMARNQTQLLADAIKAELMVQGAGENQLVAQGVGFDFPLSENQTKLGRFKNRRVEFLVYDETIMQALAQPLIPSAPIAVNTAPATYAVVDGQIVDTSTLPQGVPEQTVSDSPPIVVSQPEVFTTVEMLPPIANEPIISQGDASVPSGYIAPVPIPPQASSPIPDDLVQQIGIETDNVPSAQVESVE